jgi:hypothetical protein
MKRANKNVWQPYYLSFYSPGEIDSKKKRYFFMLRLTVKVNSNNG